MLQNLHVKNLALIDEAEDIQQICFVREPIRDL